MLERVKQKVYQLLMSDKSGHGIEHIDRVLNLSLQFAEAENSDPGITALIALLHDVDDRKLFKDIDNSKLPHARQIMQDVGVDEKVQAQVCSELSKIDYNKRLDFDKNSLPRDHITSDNYLNGDESCGINHLFEKCLRLDKLMLTESGRELANARKQITIDFLYNFFAEENAPEWTKYLDDYLSLQQ